MPRKRTQPQITNLARAWRYLAELVAANETTISCFLCSILMFADMPDGGGEPGYYGMVAAPIAPALRDTMTRQIEDDLRANGRETYSDDQDTDEHDRRGNYFRVVRCLMFALEAEDTQTQYSAA